MDLLSSSNETLSDFSPKGKVAVLRNVLCNQLELKAPIEKPLNVSWAKNIKVYEPNGFTDPHTDKYNMGRVLDGPVNPSKYFQGVPPPSYSQVNHSNSSGLKPPMPPLRPTHNPHMSTNNQTCEPAPSSKQFHSARTYKIPFDLSMDPRLYSEDIDDSASIVSSCISTFGESSEIASFSAAAEQRNIYDRYRNELFENHNTIQEAPMLPPIAAEKVQCSVLNEDINTIPTSSFFKLDELTPFGHATRKSADLESSELLVKAKSPAPYSTTSSYHFGTIRKKHKPVVTGMLEQKKITFENMKNKIKDEDGTVNDLKLDSSVFNGSSPYDEDYDSGLFQQPQTALKIFATTNSMLPDASVSTSNNTAITMNKSHLIPDDNNLTKSDIAIPELLKVDPEEENRRTDEFHLPTDNKMSQWYRNMFNQMHKPEIIAKEPEKTITSSPKTVREDNRLDEIDLNTSTKSDCRTTETDCRTTESDFSPGPNGMQEKKGSIIGKNAHFHLPSYCFRDEDPRPIRCFLSSCSKIPAKRYGTPCMVCNRPKKDPDFGEVDTLYNKTMLHVPCHFSQNNLDMIQITDNLNETTNCLDSFLRKMDETWKRSKSQPIIQITKEDDQFHKVAATKRNESIINLKAQKLSEELKTEKESKRGFQSFNSPFIQNNMRRHDKVLSDRVEDVTPDPFLKIHSPILTATAIHRFESKTARELALNRGDIVRIVRNVDAHWIEGERNGKTGIFPLSYVQLNNSKSSENVKMKAIYPFTARNNAELSLETGEVITRNREIDKNWLQGSNQAGRIGLFPKSYVAPFSSDQHQPAATVFPGRPKTPMMHENIVHEPGVNNLNYRVRFNISPNNYEPGISSECQNSLVKQLYRENKQRNEGNLHEELDRHLLKKDVEKEVMNQQKNEILMKAASLIPEGSEMFRAIYCYEPQKKDELQLYTKDIIFVVEKCDDGWFIGTSLRTGEFGIFPGNYVTRH